MTEFIIFLKACAFVIFIVATTFIGMTVIPTMLNSSNIVFVWLAFAFPFLFAGICIYVVYLFLK